MTREEIEQAYYKRIPIQFRWRSGGIEWKDISLPQPPLEWERCEYRIKPDSDSTIVIPKPKFKEGDKVLWKDYPEVKTIYEPVYYVKENIWRYLTYEGIKYLHEAELKLFKEKGF